MYSRLPLACPPRSLSVRKRAHARTACRPFEIHQARLDHLFRCPTVWRGRAAGRESLTAIPADDNDNDDGAMAMMSDGFSRYRAKVLAHVEHDPTANNLNAHLYTYELHM